MAVDEALGVSAMGAWAALLAAAKWTRDVVDERTRRHRQRQRAEEVLRVAGVAVSPASRLKAVLRLEGLSDASTMSVPWWGPHLLDLRAPFATWTPRLPFLLRMSWGSAVNSTDRRVAPVPPVCGVVPLCNEATEILEKLCSGGPDACGRMVWKRRATGYILPRGRALERLDAMPGHTPPAKLPPPDCPFWFVLVFPDQDEDLVSEDEVVLRSFRRTPPTTEDDTDLDTLRGFWLAFLAH